MAQVEQDVPLLQEGFAAARTRSKQRAARLLDARFQVTERGSTLTTEFRAGAIAFLAASNNFVVNAEIMSMAGVDTDACVVSSAFMTGVACIASGYLSNLPLGIVTSVGPNFFLAETLVVQGHCSLEGALAVSAASGLCVAFLAMTPLLSSLLGAIPLCVKRGLVIGQGLLTALIGFKAIGIVVADTRPGIHNTLVTLGDTHTLEARIFAAFLVITATLLQRGVKGAVLIGMLSATATTWACTGDWPDTYFAEGHLELHSLDFSVFAGAAILVQVLALTVMLLASISGGLLASARLAGLLDNGEVPGASKVYLVSGAATMVSAALGCSPLFVSMSASAGIRDGGRTGLVSIVLGLCCLLTALCFSPLAAEVPKAAIAPVLVLVGCSMMGEATEVRWSDTREAVPAFLCAVLQPFTYNIENGIYAGIAASVVLFITTGDFAAAKTAFLTRPWVHRTAPSRGGRSGGGGPASPGVGT